MGDGDKTQARDLTSVVASHYNQLEERGLDERSKSRILYMRNFNNWIKSMLIGDTLEKVRSEKGRDASINVLDIGAGKGGDLMKWKKGAIDHLICADIAEISVDQCKQRYRDVSERGQRQWDRQKLFTIECIAADCTKVRLKERYENPDILFDIVSIQFSFHYCFESYAQAQCMIRNASECLRPGGYFIGTTPDCFDIVRRLKEAPGLTFGNDIYSVTFPSKDEFPLFGAQYKFHLEGVVDCPEFLVYFPAFVEIAEQNGLKLVYKKRFEDYYAEFSAKDEGRSLLGHMKALETYPPFGNQDLISRKTDDYAAASEKLSQLKKDDSHRHDLKIGTMTKSEWEAVSLYVVFAFVKVDSAEEKTP